MDLSGRLVQALGPLAPHPSQCPLDLPQLLALLRQLVGEGESATLPRPVRGQPPLIFFQPMTVPFSLLIEPIERMFQPKTAPRD